MAPDPVTRWQRARTAFNHDWLKNRYLPRLAAYLNIITGRASNPRWIREFDQMVLAEWRTHAAEGRRVVEAFESTMSPAAALVRARRFTADERAWLPAVADSLWRARLDIDVTCNAARAQFDAAERAFAKLDGRFGSMPQTSSLEELEDCLKTFQAECETLAACVASLPREVRFV